MTVIELHTALRAFGYDPDAGDRMGHKTAEAVRQFRADHHLSPDDDLNEVLGPYLELNLLTPPMERKP